MVDLIPAIEFTLFMAATMGWKMLGALNPGVAVSRIIQALMSRGDIARRR